MPESTKNVAKKRPDPTKKSQVVTGKKALAHPDDVNVTALRLAPGKLSRKMAAYFKKCEEKLGFVPQCAQGLRAFDNAKLSAFVPKETAPVVGDFVARRHAPGG